MKIYYKRKNAEINYAQNQVTLTTFHDAFDDPSING